MAFKRKYFILAQNYHGATLMSKLLTGHPQVVSLADTYPSNQFDQICGCGVRISACKFWNGVKERVGAYRYRSYAAMLPPYPGIVSRRVDRYIYNTLPPEALRKLMKQDRFSQFASDYNAFLECVYSEYVPGDAGVFVDGVKSVARVLALVAGGVEVNGIIHLIRDPADFAKSTMKQKGEGFLNLVSSLVGWRFYHHHAQRLRRYVPYLQVAYEDLSDHTDDVLEKVFKFLEVPPLSAVHLVDQNVHPWHFVGNASLFAFDGQIERRKYRVSEFERRLVRMVAGVYGNRGSLGGLE